MKAGLDSDQPVGGSDENARQDCAPARRISHVFVMDVPTYPQTSLITDAAVNIAPDLQAKRDIVQNAIDLYVALGLGTPKVAILSAVETFTEHSFSTLRRRRALQDGGSRPDHRRRN